MDNGAFPWIRKWRVWAPEAVALLGLVIYLFQAFVYAHTTIPSLDEGAYLYKGILFAEGTYRPFQPYGVWTNKMPLSFLIPGYAQVLFGAGLRTGRYLAIFEGVLTLIALWVVSRRMSGRWLAAGAVWVLALSPAVIKYYSVAASQSLTACLLAWTLALVIGEVRSLWQIILSSILAGLMVLTRQNMVMVLPFLIGYVLWQHGWKQSVWATVTGLGVFIIGHRMYWPGILEIWAPWIPVNVFPQIPSFMPSDAASGGWQPVVTLSNRIVSAFQGLRVHFFAMAGSIFAMILWPRLDKWKDRASFRAAVFLAVLFFVLLWMHSWASLDQDYCVYCFTPYLAFFNVVGILLVVISLPSWKKNIHPILVATLTMLILVFITGIGFSLFEEIGNWSIGLPVPRVRGGQILGGISTLGDFLKNKYDLEINSVKKISSAVFGFSLGFLFLLLVHFMSRLRKMDSGMMLVSSFLILGILFSPLVAGSHGVYDCHSDIIRDNEIVGFDLVRSIHLNTLTYWDGGLSVVPLLYAPQVIIYPAQINDGYAYRSGLDSDSYLRFGLWNDELDQKWRQEAGYIIIEEWRYKNWKPYLTPDRFEELPRTQVSTSCLEGTRLRIFKRI